MPQNYGQWLYGYGFYGAEDSNRAISTATEVWHDTNPGIPLHPKKRLYALLMGLTSNADRMLEDLEDIRHAQHIETADSEHIDKLAQTVGVNRQMGESDAHFRARIKARVAAAITDTSHGDTVNFIGAILNTGADNIRIQTNYTVDAEQITVGLREADINASDFTEAEIRDIIDTLLPAAHTALVTLQGTFRLIADGDTNDPDRGLTSDSIQTGGTLSEDA